ncbi:MAG: DNA-directed RNA polymerase subunit alpha C-terminal domain-containing protein [Candidatus Brocadiia bacterium]
MPETTEKMQPEDFLEQPINRENYDELLERIYESFKTVDATHDAARSLLAELEHASDDEARDIHEKLGIVFHALGENEKAYDHLQDIKTRKTASHFLGRVARLLGRMEEAIEFLEKGRQGDDDLVTDMILTDIYCHQRDSEKARELCEKYSETHDDAPDWLYGIARTLETEGNYGEAMERYEEAIERDPEHRQSLFRLALNCDLNGDDERAIDLYKKCASLKPTFVAALVNLGVLHEDRQEFDKAVDCYKRVLAMDPAHQRVRMYLKDAEASMNMFIDEERRRRMRKHENLLQLPVSNIELSARSRHVLEKLGAETLEDLAGKTEQELMEFKNFGETSLQEIKDMLSRHGLSLGEETVDAEEADSGRADTQTEEMMEKMDTPVEFLSLSTRCRKCMEKLNIETVGDLVEHTEEELLETPNFGRTSVGEIKTKLSELGLSLSEE